MNEICFIFAAGEMAERLIAPVLKTGLGKTNGGSNPSLSAFARRSELRRTSPLKFAKVSTASVKTGSNDAKIPLLSVVCLYSPL